MNINEIITANMNICRNIDSIEINERDRGFASQNILAQLRNLVESVAVAILANNGQVVSSRNYQDIKDGLTNIQSQGRYKDLRKFHSFLQMSVSHYIVSEDSSERLMLKYYEYLLKLKILVKKELNLDILENIYNFPLDIDPQLSEYYEKIANRIDSFRGTVELGDRYYIHKIKPFFVEHKIYYEVSFVLATNNTSKFERVIAFTNIDIMSNYAVKLSLHRTKIDVLNRQMEIFIINDWEISIRQCEFKNFAKIFSKDIDGTTKEEYALMQWLKNEKINLVELVNSNNNYYNYIKNYVVGFVESSQFFYILDLCRSLVKEEGDGSNVIQYLLYKMNNNIIKSQYERDRKCHRLSNLDLNYGCIPFDDMPFATSLLGHNPRMSDLLDCLDTQGKAHEFFARKISNNTEYDRKLFTHETEFDSLDEVNQLYLDFNNNLSDFGRQPERKLNKFKDHFYIEGSVNDCVEILDKIKNLTVSGLSNYENAVNNWLNNIGTFVDCVEKKGILQKLFIDSHVALIYGSAGTGKSTLISHIAHYFYDKTKVFITNTHAAKSNLERKINLDKCSYLTISRYLKSPINADVLFVDEASTVDNQQMCAILKKSAFKILVLVGDNYQIESIKFGNWFDIVKSFIPESAVYELKNTYRTNERNLLNLWDKVRKNDSSMLETLVVRETDSYSQKLDESIFDRVEEDQIILCLNYDGLYGINNINRLLQESNPNKSIQWGVNTYKVGDPVLFNESDISGSIIYNNLKGVIVDFEEAGHLLWFSIEIDRVLDESHFWGSDLVFLGSNSNGKTIIKFSVEKIINTDEDDLYNKKTMPFQISYAISIHKAQGLEYNSVKVVINNEIDEAITHNVFYTAITRAKKKLKIYWSSESENKILNNFQISNFNKDVQLLNLYSNQ